MAKSITDEDRDIICKSYQDGHSPDKIHAEYGYGKNTIFRTLRKRGIPTDRKIRDPETIIDIGNMYLSGETMMAICEKYHRKPLSIKRILAKLDIKIRPMGYHLKGKPLSEEAKANRKFANTGENHWNWKGGRRIESGYVMVHAPDHLGSKSTGYVFEHRLVMEKHLGRPLEKNEVVHHINGIKTDNRIENLSLVKHVGPHYGEVICPHCGEKFMIR
jgi:hypothetical protein